MYYAGNNNQCDICGGRMTCSYCGNKSVSKVETSGIAFARFNVLADICHVKKIEIIDSKAMVSDISKDELLSLYLYTVDVRKQLCGGYPFDFSCGSYRDLLGDVVEIYSLILPSKDAKCNKIVAYRLAND
jgi:hypothetical protein